MGGDFPGNDTTCGAYFFAELPTQGITIPYRFPLNPDVKHTAWCPRNQHTLSISGGVKCRQLHAVVSPRRTRRVSDS